MKYYAGIDIGGTRIKMGIIDETGHVCVQENEATQSTRSDLMKQIGDFIKQHQEYTMEGVGISMPGIAKDANEWGNQMLFKTQYETGNGSIFKITCCD